MTSPSLPASWLPEAILPTSLSPCSAPAPPPDRPLFLMAMLLMGGGSQTLNWVQLALATPVALAVSAGRFIELGVLPLRMRALDALACSDLFVFDKTGTLTAGQPAVAAVVAVAGLDEDSCLRHAAALAAESAHPVSYALRQRVPQPRLVTSRVDNVPGAGIQATIDGTEWRLGKPDFAAEGVPCDERTQALIAEARSAGQLVSVLASPSGVQAVLLFEDPMRPGVEALLTGLKDDGVQHFTILSGDALDSVRRMGRQLGIEDARGGLSPADKLAWTQARQAQGRQLAMLGDGINDAPTLAAADVSISFADATDLANASMPWMMALMTQGSPESTASRTAGD